MFRFCCGRILLASAYYKKLDSRARLFKKLALGIPSGALDSRQNVCFPPVECSVVSARSNSNGPIRVENEITLRAAVAVSSFTSLWGKPKRWILSQSFRSSRVFRPPKHTYLEWNLLGFMELLFLLRFGTFPFEKKTICGVTSGQRWSVFPFF